MIGCSRKILPFSILHFASIFWFSSCAIPSPARRRTHVRRMVASSKCLPMICRPIGMPSLSKPQGSESAGKPARLTEIV